MGEKGKPKFKIGDTVILSLNGNVGKITDIQFVGGQYVYKINKSKGYFLEGSIQPFPQVEDQYVEKEHLDINYQFYIGDIVKVSGYDDLFKVVGCRTEIWRYKNDAWEDVIYELSRLSNGEWLEASEEEMTFIISEEQAEVMTKKKGTVNMNEIFNKPPLKLPGIKEDKKLRQLGEQQIIDDLLDQFNDYRVLYEFFRDKNYQNKMKDIMRRLKILTNKKKKDNNH